MGLFSRGKKEAKTKDSATKTVAYNGYEITPKPVKTSGGYRVEALITREKDGAKQTHHMIRSDVIQNQDEALNVTINKAKMTIDQLGDQIFKPRTN